MKIVLISSGQPSLNPRLVKEADALTEYGYSVTVIYQYWNHWGTELDKSLLASKKWQPVRIGGNPITEKIPYWLTRIRLRICRKLLSVFDFNSKLAEASVGRCTFELIKKAAERNADLYIAHNLGALPAAVIAAKKNNAKCGFDAEDFHRYEISNNPSDFDVQLKKNIEDKYIPQIDYLTASSPLISLEYQQLYTLKIAQTILNVFPLNSHIISRSQKKLKLFWFSQTIGKSRGIEQIIKALKNQENIELHLLGQCDLLTKKYLKSIAEENFYNASNIFYYDPIPSNEIVKFASQFDLGLATEIGFPLNRDICLTNKIFTYIQAGLALIASDTTAQKELMSQYPNMGSIYQKNNSGDLAKVIMRYLREPDLLKKHQNQAFENAKNKLNWDIEKKKFLSIVSNTLNKS